MVISKNNYDDFISKFVPFKKIKPIISEDSISIDWKEFKTVFYNDGTWQPNVNINETPKILYPVSVDYYINILKNKKKIK